MACATNDACLHLCTGTLLQGPVRGRTPSQFREIMSDTHKTMSAEDFGPHPEVIQTIRNVGAGFAHQHLQGMQV